MRTGNAYSGDSGRNIKKHIMYDARGNRVKSDPLSNKYLRALLFYVLPYLVINGIILLLVCSSPRISVNVKDTDNYLTAEVEFTVKSLLPIKELNVSLESEPLEYEKTSSGYKCTIDKNGTLAVDAKSLNGMSRSVYTPVNQIDDSAPSIDESSISYSRGELKFTIDDTLSGVDFSSITATLDDGETVEVSSYDANTGSVTLILPKTAEHVELHFEDMVGNAGTAKISVSVSGDAASDDDVVTGENETFAAETASTTS